MTEWPEVLLVDFVRVQEGPGLRNWQWTNSGVKVINGKNITESGELNPSNTDRFISNEEFESRYRHFEIEAGDIVVSSSGTLGKVAVVCDRHLPLLMNTSVIRFRSLDDAKLDPDFLFAFLRSPGFQDQARKFATGSAQLNFGPSHVKQMVLRLPPPGVQRNIGQVLRALDGAIEINRRRVDVLEEIAREIYREWFVRFRFPGHENVELLKSDVGPIPEGWELSTCVDELDFIGGGTPSKAVDAFWDGGTVPWYTPSDLTKRKWRYAAPPELAITEAGVAKSAAHKFPVGSVLMTSRATLGVLAIATTEATTNQGFIVVLPDARWSPGYIREWLSAQEVELAALGTGATFKEITKGAFKRFPFVVPARNVMEAYRLATDPIESEIECLEREVRVLSVMRNRLLPKLISGQIDVSGLDVDALVKGEVA